MAPHHTDSPLDTLKLSKEESARLFAQMESHDDLHLDSEKRSNRRYSYQSDQHIEVFLKHPGGTIARFAVRARNLSATGLSFVHGNFIYPDTPCHIALRHADGKLVAIPGRTTRCSHIRARIHEVGFRFEMPIDLSQFVHVTGAMAEAEQATKIRLMGKLLYIEDSIDDRELMRFLLEELGVEVMMLARGEEVTAFIEDIDFDAVMLATDLPDTSGVALARAVRQAGYERPVVAVTADESEGLHIELRRVGCDQILLKPIDEQVLAAVLAEFLPAAPADGDGDIGALYSEKWSNVRMRPLILSFLERLDQVTTDLKSSLGEGGDKDGCLKLCLDLKGSAGGYGYPRISEAAKALFRLQTDGAPPSSLQAAFEYLNMLCGAARMVLGDARESTNQEAP